MKLTAFAALLTTTVLAFSGCASGHPASTNAGLNQLPNSLRSYVHSTIARATPRNRIESIEVYGPGSEQALVKASSGDIVFPQGDRLKDTFYLLVLHGHFYGAYNPSPIGAAWRTETVETIVWSPQAGDTDDGTGQRVPPAVAKLQRLATMTLS